jgi:DNA-binding transcriptional LysR family regulator
MNLRTLKVEAPCSLIRGLIAEALPRFLHVHPGLRIVLCDSNPTAGILAHDADVAIRIGHVTEFDLLANQIGVVRWVTCASPDFIECNGVPDRRRTSILSTASPCWNPAPMRRNCGCSAGSRRLTRSCPQLP